MFKIVGVLLGAFPSLLISLLKARISCRQLVQDAVIEREEKFLIFGCETGCSFFFFLLFTESHIYELFFLFLSFRQTVLGWDPCIQGQWLSHRHTEHYVQY